MPFFLKQRAVSVPPMRLPQTLLNGKTLRCLPGLAVRSSCHWDVMECGTLNTNEALCGDIDLLPFHSGMRVPAACCMCHGRSSLCNGELGGVRAGYVTHFSGGGCGVTHRFSCLEFSRGDGGHIPLYCSEEYTQIYSNIKWTCGTA